MASQKNKPEELTTERVKKFCKWTGDIRNRSKSRPTLDKEIQKWLNRKKKVFQRTGKLHPVFSEPYWQDIVEYYNDPKSLPFGFFIIGLFFCIWNFKL